ncbi:hypothetical protein [Shimia litoralis]|uniref:hypothetical protein n=1 Tax=Shimia litoralis TaxID=420403 RepID=UPI001FE7D4EA|nr:hypothetical protein [Shimia litoralis]
MTLRFPTLPVLAFGLVAACDQASGIAPDLGALGEPDVVRTQAAAPPGAATG